MTQEEQQIAIAIACGWKQGTIERIYGKPERLIDERWAWTPPDGWLQSESIFAKAYLRDRNGGNLFPPDYLNDLNAMHEAEKVLTDSQYADYSLMVCGSVNHRPLSAIAAQRAEAFLKTLNLWK